MNAKKKKQLSRQLKEQAAALEQQDGSALDLSMASAGAALLRAVGTVADEKMPQEDFESLYAQYLSLGQIVEDFFRGAESRLRTEAESQSCKESLEKLTSGRRDAERIRQEISGTKDAQRELDSELAKLRTKREDAQKKLDDAQTEWDSLQKLMEGCSQEIIDAQRKKNEVLKEKFISASATLRDLENAHTQTETDLTRIEQKIAALPEENQRLLDSYEEKRELLERLETARIACSPEKQAELEERIKAISPEVEENQQAAEVLADRLEDLEEQNVRYDRERQTLSTNILDLLENALGDLSRTLTDHEGRLEEIRLRAETLADRLAGCLETRRRCQDWLDADVDPLEAMVAAVGRPEAQQLRKTLDPGGLQEVRQLRSEVEERLRRLDEILGRCVTAVRMDQDALNKRARR